jgi:hypothetical protein
MAAASFLRVSRIAVAFFACLLTLVLAPSAARAQAQLRVARLPAVLAHHFTNVPLTVFPRGFDIVASNDTVVLGLWLENTGNQPALNVQAQLQNQPGLTFSPPTVQFGNILPGATASRVVSLITTGAQYGSYPIPTQILWNAGSTSQTTWISVWDEQVTIDNLPSGLFHARITTPYTTHHYRIQAPEQFVGGVPDYFNLQSIRDTIDFAEPFYGIHWGECFLADHVEPVKAEDHASGSEILGTTMIHQFKVQNRSGSPIAGATVTQRVGDFVVSGITDANGKVTFTDVPTGDGVDIIDPPDFLADTYRTTRKNHPKVDPGPGMKTVTDVTYPNIPTRVIAVQTGPPSNAQGGNANDPDHPVRTVVAGVTTAVGTGILDALAFVSIPGAGWLIGAASVVGSGLVGVGAAAGADPAGQDLTFAGEEHTEPLMADERTLQEQIDVTIGLTQPPRGCTQQSMATSFTFTRVTDMGVYTWSGNDTPTIPDCLDFDVRLVGPGPALVVHPRNDPTPSTRSSDYLVLAWFANASGQQALSQLLLQDNGIAPDSAANDGNYSIALPGGSLNPGNRLFIWVTRSGFDAGAIPLPMVMREVPLGSVSVEGASGVHGVALAIPWPNPASDRATFEFTLPREGRVTLRLIDVAGRIVRTWMDGARLAAGSHEVEGDFRELGAGLYFVSLRVTDATTGRTEPIVTRRLVISP